MSDLTMHNAGNWRERLTELLGAQRSAVTQLNELAQKQGSHIREGRSDALLSLLARRQELIDRFLAEHTEMQSLLTDVSERIHELGDGDRASIRTMIDEINTLLGEVLRRDEEDGRLLEEARGSVRIELSSMKSARKARNAYLGAAGHSAEGSRFADQQG